MEELKQAVRTATIGLKGVPILCGAALRNKGIQPLLDAYRELPSLSPGCPAHRRSRSGNCGNEEPRRPRSKGPFSALAFKVMMDQGRKMTYIRIYSGTVKAGDTVLQPRARRSRKSWPAFSRCTPTRGRGSKRPRPGIFVAVMGLKITTTGDTLCSRRSSHPAGTHPLQHPGDHHGRGAQTGSGPGEAYGRPGEALGGRPHLPVPD